VLLLVTNRDDLTADWLVLELERRQASFYRFNTEDYPACSTLRWHGNEAELCVSGTTLRSRDITAVWWRRPLSPRLPAGLSDREATWAAGESLAALEGFMHTLDAHWVSHPEAIERADSKMEQLRRAVTFGFEVPVSLVTNDRVAARSFLADTEPAICKSLRSARVPTATGAGLFYTATVAPDDLDDAADFGPEPYLFQERVPKSYEVRVTVIGDEAYACRICSQDHAESRTDWRLADVGALEHSAERLPREVAEQCVALTRSYGLRFSAIDLARRPDDAYVFFELNANGQWAWIEKLTGLPLAARLADEMIVKR
jgi:glutathione synthase/RimK-type ligase-like ATP-grasp enzyme